MAVPRFVWVPMSALARRKHAARGDAHRLWAQRTAPAQLPTPDSPVRLAGIHVTDQGLAKVGRVVHHLACEAETR